MKTSPAVVTLVVGGEQLLVERAIDRVVRTARAADAQTERRDIYASEPGAVGSLAQALSPTLFGGGAVVVLHAAEVADESLLAAVVGAVDAIEPGTALVVVHAGGAKGKKVLERLSPLAGERVDCVDIKRGRATSDFVSAEFKAHKHSITPDALGLLIAAVGSDLRELAAACAQLSADIEDNQIGVDDVGTYFGGTAEVTGFQISDAVVNKQAVAALRLVRLAETTDGGRLGPATVANLANALRQLVAVAAAPPGMSERDLAVAAKVPPWKVRTLTNQARRWKPADIAKAVIVLATLDAAVKGGLREGEQLAASQKGLVLEQAVVQLAAR